MWSKILGKYVELFLDKLMIDRADQISQETSKEEKKGSTREYMKKEWETWQIDICSTSTMSNKVRRQTLGQRKKSQRQKSGNLPKLDSFFCRSITYTYDLPVQTSYMYVGKSNNES